MLIDRIDLFHVAMPLIYPWRTAYGEDAAIHSVLCRMSAGSCYGWGESAPFAAPCYSPESAGGAFVTARDWLAPAVIGKRIGSGDDLQREMQIFKGNPFAKAALDTAWWSLHCQVTGQTLPQAIGATRTEVQVGADFGVMDSIDDLLSSIESAVSDRFPRVKLKFRPGWDIPMLQAVRKRFPDQTFHIDCNSGYRLSDVSLFQHVDEFQLAMIEQPLAYDDLLDHSRLQTQVRTPICLDESIISRDRVRQAIELGSCRYVNIKPGRVGGLTNAIAIHNDCQLAGIPCWVGGMLESAVGSAHCASLAMLDNFTYPPDIFPSSRFYRQDLADPPLELQDDRNGIPSITAPAILPEPAPDRLKSLTIQSAVLRKND